MRNLVLIIIILIIPISSFSTNLKSDNLVQKVKALCEDEKLDKAYWFLQKAKALIGKDTIEFDLFQLSCAYGYYYFAKEEDDNAFNSFQKAESFVSLNSITSVEKAYLWYGYGGLYEAKGEYEIASEYYIKSSDELKAIYNKAQELEVLYLKSKFMTSRCYIYAGQIVKAKEGYLALLPLFEGRKLFALEYRARANLAYCYDVLGEFDKAIYHLEKCENINEELNTRLTNATNNLGIIYYLSKNDRMKAKYYFNKVIKVIENDNNANKEAYSYALENLCSIYVEEKDFEQAYRYVNVALKNAIELYGSTHILTCKILSEKGRVLIQMGKVEEAKLLFAKVYQGLSIDIYNKSTYENISYLLELYNTFLLQTVAYLELYENSNDIDALKMSDFLSDVNITMIQNARSSLADADSKTALMKSAQMVFEVKVEVSKLLYDITKEERYINNAFEVFEKTNNIILTEAVLKDGVANKMGLPQEIYDQEISLKSNLAETESKLFNTIQNSPNDSIEIDSNEKLVADAKFAYRSFISNLKNTHPNYYNYNYNNEVTNIDQLQQQLLTDTQSIVHYYLSEKEIYCIAINKDEVGFYKIPHKEKIVEKIQLLRYGILQAHKQRDSSAGLEDVIEASAGLYDELIRPIEIQLKKNLAIIPMGELSFIPFDVLLKKKPNRMAEFYDYKYMLKDHAISYSYSSTLLNDAKEKINILNVKNNFVGFAPVFESRKIASSRSEMVSLAFNESEVKNIKELIGGDIYTDLKASKEKFVEVCKDYKILHLATHGVSNSKEGDNSYLAFSENLTSENSLLYARDIYNLKINADLVVLSACETAIGELKLAEGIISLGRAFTYAGAQSNITTLWQVNDGAASLLMQNFYKEIKQGVSKDEALRNAKLNYIAENSNVFAHPFYWSAFIPIGDMAALELIETTNNLEYGLFGGVAMMLIGIGGFLLFRKKRRAKLI